jgi:hypothetical protein
MLMLAMDNLNAFDSDAVAADELGAAFEWLDQLGAQVDDLRAQLQDRT